MKNFDQQLIADLEFDKIRELLAGYCTEISAREKMLKLSPFRNMGALRNELNALNEFQKIQLEGATFPAIAFQEIQKELRVLKLEGSSLPVEAFPKILDINSIINKVVLFLEKNEIIYPELFSRKNELYHTKDIEIAIAEIFKDQYEIKDNASPDLLEIRKKLRSLKRQIDKEFADSLKYLSDQGWLADYRESVVQNKRVLVLQAEYKRKVKGKNLGSSKTGKFVYLEPAKVTSLDNDQANLKIDEQNEIYKILRELTAKVRLHYSLLVDSNKFLIYLDMLQAKTQLSISMKACLPVISDDKNIEYFNAYHPLLFLENRSKKEMTFPQDISLNSKRRILVISGPNAGGKSVTLKTMGLLQIMIQSGLLIPVGSNSKAALFERVLTDIGDNQSIENHLSTYSYRLKNMKKFLQIIDNETLLLLDEFGTGSDPELGGALAEVFFEEIYEKESYCVITTHYANIKVKAFEYKEAENACMLFDEKSLQPLFKLLIGQPGSSFTFEVAKMNGIGNKLVQRARRKLDNKTVRLDDVMIELQRNRSQVESLKGNLQKAERSAETVEEKYLSKLNKLKQRSTRQQESSEKNNEFIIYGRKMKAFISDYKPLKKNEKLKEKVETYLAAERSKIDISKRVKAHKISKASSEGKNYKFKHNQHKISEGCIVRLLNNKKWGTVMSLDKKGVVVQFGEFITKVDIEKLIWVKDE